MPPLVLLGLAWLWGIATVALWDAPPWMAPAMLAALLPAVFAGWLRMPVLLLVAAVLLAGAGAWRHDAWLDRDPPAIASHAGKEITAEARVVSLPQPGRTVSRYTIEVQSLEVDGRPAEADGKLLITLGEYADWPYGTRIRIQGTVEEAPVFPDFDYRSYLARQGIGGTMFLPSVTEIGGPSKWDHDYWIAEVRLRLEDALQRALPEPESSLATGIALGRDGNISDELYEDYRRSGLAHIIAVSGSNVSLLTGMVFLALVPLVGRNAAILPSALVVVFYVFVAGADASVVRAGIMAAVFLGGMALGRQQAGIAALAAAAIGMTVFSPGTAADLGFQLSLAATAGLLVFAPWMEWALVRMSGETAASVVPRPLYRIASWTTAATVATAPLLWLNFGELSTAGVVANLLVEPVFAFALGLALATAVAGAAWEPAGWLLGLAAWYPLALLNWTASLFGSQAWSSVSAGGASGTIVAGMYAGLALLGGVAFRWPPPEDAPAAPQRRPVLVRRGAYGALAGALIVAVVWASIQPIGGPGELEIAFLDVGQGDAALITTPNGKRLLIDGGPSGIELARELSAVTPHWLRRIDHVFLSHAQQDHVAGLVELGRRYKVGTVYEGGSTNDSQTYGLFAAGYEERQALRAGDRLQVDGVALEVLWPPAGYAAGDPNDASLVLRLEYGDVSVLFTGDIEAGVQRELVAAGEGVEATVLKVPHHGAATSAPEFFAAVGANLAVVSAGEGNRFGHPRDETLAMLDGTHLYRTDEDGLIVVSVDSSGEVRVWRER